MKARLLVFLGYLSMLCFAGVYLILRAVELGIRHGHGWASELGNSEEIVEAKR